MKRPVVIACVVALAAIAIVLGLNRGRRTEAPTTATEQKGTAPAVAQKLAPVDFGRPVEKIVELTSASTTLVAQAVESRDESVTQQIEEEMRQLEMELQEAMTSLSLQLVGDEKATSEVLEMMRNQDDPDILMMLARALGESAAFLGDRFPVDELLSMAESDESTVRRQAALAALGYSVNVSDETRQRIAKIAESAASPEERTAAISALGSIAYRNEQLADQVREDLLPVLKAADHPMLRGLAIQTIGNMDRPLSEPVLNAMADAVRNETVAGNRSLAALALGGGTSRENQQQVLDVLTNAFNAEANVETQRHILTQLVKVTRDPAFLNTIASSDGLVIQDIADYREILATVDRDNWSAIWEAKNRLNEERGTVGESGHEGMH